MHKSSPWKGCLFAMGLIAVLLFVYFASYYALVIKSVESFDLGDGRGASAWRPRYRLGGDVSETFFFFGHCCDRAFVRTEYWKEWPK